MQPPSPRPGRRTGTGRERPRAHLVVRPIPRFLRIEAAGGIALLVATAAALAWANSPVASSYATVFHTEVAVRVGGHRLAGDLAHGVDDALMALFFLVVGLEIKREWVTGALRDRRAAALPVGAAIGGMLVPAALYLAVNLGGDGAAGWGIPMATDIAFALGVVALLGRRVPGPLRVFLLTLAIVDDIGAIVVIAVFYAGSIGLGWLAAAGATVLIVAGLRRARVAQPLAYVALGLGLWLFLHRSGVHATLAGVAMGLLAPATPIPDRTPVPVTDRLIALLHPWTSFVVIPLFALANAGVEIRGESLRTAGPVTVGVVVGLVAGKTIGVTAGAWIATRLGVARLPDGVTWTQMVGAAALAGIGFTVSLFIAGLAFAGDALRDAKVGILLASGLAAIAGSTVLATTDRAAGRRATAPTGVGPPPDPPG